MRSSKGINKGKSHLNKRKHVMKLDSFEDYLVEELKDPEFKKGYEEEKRKLHLGYQIFLARERLGITQQELAGRIGTRQSNISRLEFGNYNFTVEMLRKIADALDLKLEVKLIQKPFRKAA